MDTQRSSFGHEDGGSHGDSATDAPGIEAPPMIGQDERRMHVRAYNFWAKLLEGRSFPSIESLDLENLGDFGEHCVLLDFTSGIDNPAIAYLGATLARECEIDDSVQHIDDVPRRSLLSRLTDHYLQIIANRAPIGFEAEFVNAKGHTILYRGVLMPFSSDDDTIDFVMGVINWKQAADSALTDAIAQEMEAAVVAAPHPRPTLPVWNDGPEAANDSYDEEGEDQVALPAATSMAALIRPRGEPLLAAMPDDDDVFELGAAYAVEGFADVPTAEDAGEDVVEEPVEDAADMGLADWLASARTLADTAAQANARGHAALYQAIGRASGFARAAAAAPEDYAELLEEAGITASPRAPMTPVVKLVFGVQHDKTRLAEYAAVLMHADREAIDPAALPGYLSGYDGGLKALVRDIRARNRADSPQPETADPANALRQVAAFGSIDWPEAPEGDFVLLLARREADGTLSLIAASGESDASTGRYMKQVARQVGTASPAE